MLDRIKGLAKSKNIIVITSIFLGSTLLGYGLTESPDPESLFTPSPAPSVISTPLTHRQSSSPISDPESTEKMHIDIQGAVNNPGVYQFSAGQRISDALIAAGELSKQADKLWVSQNINRALTLQDGDKIYIPTHAETLPQSSPSPIIPSDLPLGYQPVVVINSKSSALSQAPINTTTLAAQISLNSATIPELESLPGIGAVRAQKIIDNRPYSTLEELVNKKVVSKNLYQKIKGQLIL